MITDKKTYILHEGSFGAYKIGRSKDPFKRRGSLCLTVNKTQRIIIICDTDKEQFLHSYFSSKRKHGEFFVLTDSDLNLLKKKFGFFEVRDLIYEKNNGLMLTMNEASKILGSYSHIHFAEHHLHNLKKYKVRENSHALFCKSEVLDYASKIKCQS